jgi:hypothetical protein
LTNPALVRRAWSPEPPQATARKATEARSTSDTAGSFAFAFLITQKILCRLPILRQTISRGSLATIRRPVRPWRARRSYGPEAGDRQCGRNRRPCIRQGGSHASFPAKGYDFSGAVSYVLHSADLHDYTGVAASRSDPEHVSGPRWKMAAPEASILPKSAVTKPGRALAAKEKGARRSRDRPLYSDYLNERAIRSL